LQKLINILGRQDRDRHASMISKYHRLGNA
jgi:hypothetical protein